MTVSDKVKNRLEQLDDFEDGSVKEMLNLSQQDYIKRIEDLNKALIQAWDQDQKVKALKIAIQVRRLPVPYSVLFLLYSGIKSYLAVCFRSIIMEYTGCFSALRCWRMYRSCSFTRVSLYL